MVTNQGLASRSWTTIPISTGHWLRQMGTVVHEDLASPWVVTWPSLCSMLLQGLNFHTGVETLAIILMLDRPCIRTRPHHWSRFAFHPQDNTSIDKVIQLVASTLEQDKREGNEQVSMGKTIVLSVYLMHRLHFCSKRALDNVVFKRGNTVQYFPYCRVRSLSLSLSKPVWIMVVC